MACLFGLFVLFFVWMVMTQVVLGHDLESERASLVKTRAKLSALESVLAGPLASGLITLVDGRIGIRGAVLFESSEAELSKEGRKLLQQLAPPLATFVQQNEVALMISGFTDDKQLKGNGEFIDNWELSAQRALTVTRALIDAGLPADALIAAGFGEHHPVAPNATDEQRAQNRRVEIAPVPRPESFHAHAAAPQAAP
jgi:outer membrane protein OmpA-like peptidoglycan-associated protein